MNSNLLRADYAGSSACRPCHGDIHDEWARSPMHRMTRNIDQADIKAPFSGEILRLHDDTAALESQGGQRFVRISSGRFGDHLFRVTRVIGGRHREDFAGQEVRDGGAGGPRDERILPISYMIASGTLRYKGYSVMQPERPGLKPGAVWNRTCIFCHNTVPYLSTILGALAGPGASPYQGEVVDPLLPAERRSAFVITDPAALRQAVAAEISRLGGPSMDRDRRPLQEVLLQAVKYTRARFDREKLVEVGIGCESCHGGSAEHVRDFHLRPSFQVRSAFLQVLPESRQPDEAHAQQINRTCARCHQVLFSRYPYTWEGGLRASGQAHQGGSHINSGEARDFLLGACTSKLSCAACHDPHSHDSGPRRQELEGRAGNAVCAGCHQALASDEALRAHAHHDPQGPGGLCMNCHMPRKNMSLDTKLTRYHRIGSPTERVKVEGDRPLECALCHADRTVESLVLDMERLWGARYDRAALKRLYGDLAGNVMLATLSQGKPHEQAVAMYALGEQRERRAVPLLYRQLVHPYPILRYYAVQALGRILGVPAPAALDSHGESAQILQAGRSWLEGAGFALSEVGAGGVPVPSPAAEPEE